MKIKTKIVIFLIAALLSLIEFNLIVSFCCFEDMLDVSKKATYGIASNTLSIEE